MDDTLLYPPWGTSTAAYWTTPQPAAEPTAAPPTSTAADPEPAPAGPDLQQRLAVLHEAVGAGLHDRAQLLAETLDADTTAAHGEEHLATIHVREVRGYVAGLLQHPRTALAWYLHTLQLRGRVQGPAHPDIEDAARRAYSLWRTLPADQAAQTGPDLISTVTGIQGPDAPTVQRTRRRLAELQS
ncbi:hypothetical protein ACWCQL_13255 [Streptomyces sp. NPDC002073]